MSGGVNNYGVVPHPENGLVYFPGGARDGVLFGLNADGTSNFSQALYNATTGCSRFGRFVCGQSLGGAFLLFFISDSLK